ncbi:hypothetical protein MTR62_14825 [Novosphingobium sp. 1949]|uniref:Methyl-accepting chemotaxis protein n=1 Tax=Novosphingobium organovorum TaxID=2930092 RepID=A0ABT0BGR8_9SPHN|nr:hypothetical protein [Novosphingobium organovorum]MCJ2183959.1 hypothetical protein [Novosphingobium organovorum]
MEALRPEQLDLSAPLADATAPLRAQLESTARGLDGAFNQAGEQLGETAQVITFVIEALHEMTRVFDNGEASAAIDSLTASARRLALVSRAVSQRGELMARIQSAVQALRRSIDDVQRCLRALHIYGMNVKIAASGEPAFVDFADQMSGKLKAADSQTKGFEARLADLSESLTRMQRNDQLLLGECAKVIPQVPDRLIGDADALRGYQAGLVRLAGTTRTVAQAIQRELGNALVAIQVGDRARQRLEHVVTGATLLEAQCAAGQDEPAAMAEMRAHTLTLLQALTSEIAAEYQSDAGALLASLERLRRDTEQVSALRGPDDGPGKVDETQFLRRIEDGIAEAATMIERLQSADAQAAETLEVILATVADVSVRVRAIRELRIDVRQMAINIGLRCRKVERIGRPVTVIANEIRSHSDQLDTIILTINRAETDLSEVSETMREQAGDHDSLPGNELTRSLQTIRDCAQNSDMAMSTVEQGTATAVEMLRLTCSRLDEAMEHAPRIAEAAQALTHSADPGAATPQREDHPVRALLTEIGRTYTMVGERRIHDRFLLPGMPPLAGTATAAPAAAGWDAMGDGLEPGDADDGLFDDGLFGADAPDNAPADTDDDFDDGLF